MTYDPARHHRRSIRLQGYDYTQAGAYFITICTANRRCLFGDMVGGQMRLNDAGRVAAECWHAIPDHFPNTELDEFVVMPNHIHGILVITAESTVGFPAGAAGAKNVSPLRETGIPFVSPETGIPSTAPQMDIPSTAAGAKNIRPLRPTVQPGQPHTRPRGTSKTVGSMVRGFKIGVTKWARENTLVHTVWQRNYWEHIVRNEQQLNRIRAYIANNPVKWQRDRFG